MELLLLLVFSTNFLLTRCMIRDVAVKVPEPEDFIAESVFPSHIIVPRCSGEITCPVSRVPRVSRVYPLAYQCFSVVI